MRPLLAVGLACLSLAASAQTDSLAVPDPRLEAAFADLDYVYTFEDNGAYSLVFELDSLRSQVAFVRAETIQFDDLEFREVYSFAQGPSEDGQAISPELALRLLSENSALMFGGWGTEGGAIVFMAPLDANASPLAVANALFLVMNPADALEAELNPNADEW